MCVQQLLGCLYHALVRCSMLLLVLIAHVRGPTTLLLLLLLLQARWWACLP
jgi:hypothetical protein